MIVRRRLVSARWAVALGVVLLAHALAKHHLASLDPIAAMVRGGGAAPAFATVVLVVALRVLLFVVAPVAAGALVGRLVVLRSAPDAAKEQRAPAGNARSGE